MFENCLVSLCFFVSFGDTIFPCSQGWSGTRYPSHSLPDAGVTGTGHTPWCVLHFSPTLCLNDYEVSGTNSQTLCFWGLKPAAAASIVGLLSALPAPSSYLCSCFVSNLTTSIWLKRLALCSCLPPQDTCDVYRAITPLRKCPLKPRDNSLHPPLWEAGGHARGGGLVCHEFEWLTHPSVHWSHSDGHVLIHAHLSHYASWLYAPCVVISLDFSFHFTVSFGPVLKIVFNEHMTVFHV